VPEPPEPLANLLTGSTKQCRQFRRDIRKYNCALCLASLQANEVSFSSGPSVFKVQGEVHRFTRPLRQADGQEPKHLQTFFVDASMQADIGNRRFVAADVSIMKDLRVMMESSNSYKPNFITLASSQLAPNMFGASSELASVMEFGLYVRSFMTIDEQLQSGLLPQSVSLEHHQPTTEHCRRYNLVA